MSKRTTHRSSKGAKLYAVRDKKGQFKDIQTYKRAHSADLRKRGTRGDRKAIRQLDEDILMLKAKVAVLTEEIAKLNRWRNELSQASRG